MITRDCKLSERAISTSCCWPIDRLATDVRPLAESPTRRVIASAWLYNELGQLIPLPQQSWDKESATGPVGNYDLTPAGASAIGMSGLAPVSLSVVGRS